MEVLGRVRWERGGRFCFQSVWSLYLCACVRPCVRACVRACVCVCVCFHLGMGSTTCRAHAAGGLYFAVANQDQGLIMRTSGSKMSVVNEST